MEGYERVIGSVGWIVDSVACVVMIANPENVPDDDAAGIASC